MRLSDFEGLSFDCYGISSTTAASRSSGSAPCQWSNTRCRPRAEASEA